MTGLSVTTKADIDKLLKQYQLLLDEAEEIKFINKSLNKSYQNFYIGYLNYYDDLKKTDVINEKEGQKRKKELEQICTFLQKMNRLARNYETMSDMKELKLQVNNLFTEEVRKLPEKIAYYSLVCLLSFIYVASAILAVTLLTGAFTTPIPAVIFGLTVGTPLGVTAACMRAQADAFGKTYNFFRSYDPKPIKNAVDFMHTAECTWAHRFEEDYNNKTACLLQVK
ncbi:hypothetical protein OQJ15_14770 [Fluoribacter dumoffii]|uniref:Uncharacterized protein n=1 Tax=Fluoribacter dumoffii TaxID=463 RepID=A0A377GDT2_9GAMM|nr:hypothetical protein [Fluoribacter dumoffii]KTC91264.1 hypothetical protein Ldum_2332 [Fluoribacter dumoffii NY 23]MCW8387568.1 hypothetical protein [Fluoribacter dumoffii]MCW8497771.1 hypothetical protein [Fluoribacter dumoffii]STO22962.1 Uncharacterised protein [Fluoribacter dumoffii]